MWQYGMSRYLWRAKVLLKDFGAHAQALSQQIKDASESLAAQLGRPMRYLASASQDKEAIARQIAAADGIEAGLICILSAVEPCWSFEIVRNARTRELELTLRQRKCLHLYHYSLDEQLGFMHARIQTWLPFQIQVCLNGRERLARRMDAAGLGYVRRDNCFTWLEDAEAAQRLMDEQLRTDWPELLTGIARRLNPRHEAMFAPYPTDYYWSTYQSEWASDVLFRDPESLARLYPKLVRHGLTTFLSPDVMRFLGRKIAAQGPERLPRTLEVVSNLKTRPEGVRIKHRLGANSIKMYDKQGSVLRVETTINNPADFKSFRPPEGKPDATKAWRGMRKGIADLHRRAQVSQAANDRYLAALASVEDQRSLGELSEGLAKPAWRNGRRFRAINPYAPDDAKLLEAISRGEFALNGLRNRDLRRLLFPEPADADQQRREAARVSRKLALLRAHGLIRKVPHTHRYVLTALGRASITALITARNASASALLKLAA
jgi:hypothetical protein